MGTGAFFTCSITSDAFGCSREGWTNAVEVSLFLESDELSRVFLSLRSAFKVGETDFATDFFVLFWSACLRSARRRARF